jgi:hypothetical protein
MQADPQVGQLLRPADGILNSRCRHHQAGGGQDPRPTRLFYSLIDEFVQTKVIGGDNQKPVHEERCARAFITSSPQPRVVRIRHG